MSELLLIVEGLTAELGDPGRPLRVVDGVSLRVKAGETFALVGESGCGKSMTALALMRLLPPGGRIASGSVRLDGTDLLRLPEYEMRKIRGGRLAMIFQEPQTALNPVLSVGAQIAEAIELHQGRKGRHARAEVIALLCAVGLPDAEHRFDDYPHQLSGGMQQRVMIAMALAGNPQLLIADEPTTALDVTIQAQVLDLLKALQTARGLAVLLITHDLGVVAEYAERLAVMYAGQIVETAPVAEFFNRPGHPYSRQLLASLPEGAKRGQPLRAIEGQPPPPSAFGPGCRFAERCLWAEARCRQAAPPWEVLGAGHEVCCHRALELTATSALGVAHCVQPSLTPLESPAAPILEVRDLRVHFPIRAGILRRTVGWVRAVDGVSLDLGAGQTLALVGESGCGKSTAARAILQLIPPTGGSVRYQGQELVGLDYRRLRPFRKELQIIFQDPAAAMNPRMLVGDTVGEGLKALGIVPNRAERLSRVAKLLEQVGLDQSALNRYPHEFSGGQRQRICIARALALEPKVLICDEPTSALDVSVQAQIINLLRDLQARLGLAYLLITHDFAVVSYLADAVAVMYLGQIVEYGPVSAILEAPRHPYTRALLAAVPQIDPQGRRPVLRLVGELPSPQSPPSGCRFHPRCPEAAARCRHEAPPAVRLGAGHWVQCHLAAGEGVIDRE
ncbi:ABC transporter ATP-binding protein [Caldichromatium japonicum]|uniref:ABC-type dipeptide transporter n=1 Tax=Caldichromatium japonicum TaxID=2699430 RepID=A0A6G7VBD0_9GAMM|nr:ABC transporter ATP-binding protein [Caldichromatium japonicum]QIK37369.1 ABC transporter ATP-binding protein [Caldichromatium japonicum]